MKSFYLCPNGISRVSYFLSLDISVKSQSSLLISRDVYTRFLLSLLFLKLNNPRSHSPSSYVKSSNPVISFIALHWISSSLSVSLLLLDLCRMRTSIPDVFPKCRIEKKDYLHWRAVCIPRVRWASSFVKEHAAGSQLNLVSTKIPMTFSRELLSIW